MCDQRPAKRQFGSGDAPKCYGQSGITVIIRITGIRNKHFGRAMGTIVQDIRVAMRMLLKNPAFGVVVRK